MFWNRIRNMQKHVSYLHSSSEMVQVCTLQSIVAPLCCSIYFPHQLLKTKLLPNRLSSQVQLPRCFPTSRGTTASLELVHCAPCLVCRPRFQMVPTPCQTLAMVVRDPFMLGSSTLQWLWRCRYLSLFLVWMSSVDAQGWHKQKQRSGLF